MVEAHRLKQTLLGIPSLELRRDWMRDHFAKASPARAAHELDALCESGERGDLAAREVLFAAVLLLLDAPFDSLWRFLRAEALDRGLFSAERLLRFEPLPSEAIEAVGDLPVPDYGVGRELTLGERRNLARRSPRAQIDRLLSDPHPMVIQQLLLNPRLTEDDLVRLAARRPAGLPVLRAVARAPRWLKSERVRLSILFNPGAPSSMTVPMTALCSRQHLRELAHSAHLGGALRTVALERMERLPPLQAAPTDLIH